MEFSGRVYFKYDCGDAWQFYRFARALAESGVSVTLEWQPMPTDDTRLAASVHAKIARSADPGRFFHAMFGLVHLEGMEASDVATVGLALEQAGVSDVDPEADDDMLTEMSTAIASLGVTSSPTLYRHGPVVAITVNPAALQGDLAATARTILSMADNDGIWELRKP